MDSLKQLDYKHNQDTYARIFSKFQNKNDKKC